MPLVDPTSAWVTNILDKAHDSTFMTHHYLSGFKNTFFSIKAYQRLWPYVAPSLPLFLLAMLCAIMVGLLDAMMPLAIKLFMDTIFEHKNLLEVLQSLPAWVSPFLSVLKPYESSLAQINLIEKAFYIPVGIVLFTIVQGVFNYTSNVANSIVRVDVSQRLKQDLFSKLLNYEATWYDGSSSGEVISHFCGDSDTATAGLTDILKTSTIRFFSVAGLALTLLGLSPKLAFIALGVLGTIVIPISFSRKYLKRVSEQSLHANTQLTIPYIEALQGNRVIKLFQLQLHQLNMLKTALKVVRKVSIRMAQISGVLTPLMHTIAGLGIGLVLYYGSILIQDGTLSAGGFAAFITSLILLYTPVKSLGNSSTQFHLAFIALERVFVRIDRPIEATPVGQVHTTHLQKAIEIKDLSFQYRPHLPWVLKHINLTIHKGQSVAFVGGSGSGKSTMAHLLLRLYDPSKGAIFIDGTPIHDIEETAFRHLVSAVFQDNFIFHGTLRDNLLLIKPSATEAELKQALANAYLLDMVENQLPNGLDTVLGERGVLLSGGQRQRLAIARALLRNAPILVLDEATSALDNESERMVQQAIDVLMRERTVIVIAHRLSTIQHCDLIAVMNHGEIVETGTHQSLLAQNGAYAKLHRSGDDLMVSL